jgi:GcrA cell cycle regulator
MTDWTEAMDQQLRDGWKEGLSRAQIARLIGGSITSSSVGSRRRRMGLPGRGVDARRETTVLGNQVRRKDFCAPKPKGFADVKAFTQLEETKPRPWLTRRVGECAWPVGGEGADTLSCCAKVRDLTRAYCDRHLALRHGNG